MAYYPEKDEDRKQAAAQLSLGQKLRYKLSLL